MDQNDDGGRRHKALRTGLGLTISHEARLLRANRRSVERWESGEQTVQAASELLLMLMQVEASGITCLGVRAALEEWAMQRAADKGSDAVDQ